MLKIISQLSLVEDVEEEEAAGCIAVPITPILTVLSRRKDGVPRLHQIPLQLEEESFPQILINKVIVGISIALVTRSMVPDSLVTNRCNQIIQRNIIPDLKVHMHLDNITTTHLEKIPQHKSSTWTPLRPKKFPKQKCRYLSSRRKKPSESNWKALYGKPLQKIIPETLRPFH